MEERAYCTDANVAAANTLVRAQRESSWLPPPLSPQPRSSRSRRSARLAEGHDSGGGAVTQLVDAMHDEEEKVVVLGVVSGIDDLEGFALPCRRALKPLRPS